MLQDSVISSGDDKNSQTIDSLRKKIEIRIFPLLPVMAREKRLRSSSRSKVDTRASPGLPRIINKHSAMTSSHSRKQFDVDILVSEMSDLESIDVKTIDDESIYQTSFLQNRDSDSTRATANNRQRKSIRPSYNTEHEFLDRELFEIKSGYKKFKKKHSKYIKAETSDGDSFNEIEYLDCLKELVKEYEKKSKLKNIEDDILFKKTRNLKNEAFLTYTRSCLKFKFSFEKHIIELIERMKDLYYDHINKCCCNFSSIDYNLVKSSENDIIEEEFFEEIEDDKSSRANSIVNSYQKALNKNNNPNRNFNINVIYDNDKMVKQLNDIVKSEFHDINKLLAKLNSIIGSFYTFIRMRLSYVTACNQVLKKIEIILKTFFEWVKQDKKFLDNLTECIEYMQRKSKEKEKKHLLLQSKLQSVHKKAGRVNKDIDMLKKRHSECVRYVRK